MLRSIVFLFAVAAAFGAEDGWEKVRQLRSGSELRIYKRAEKQPILAKLDEASEERLVVVLKNEQVSIAKDDIDRLDARPPRTGGRFTRETRTTRSTPERQPANMPTPAAPVPSTSSSSSVTINSKPDFEMVYRRPLPKP